MNVHSRFVAVVLQLRDSRRCALYAAYDGPFRGEPLVSPVLRTPRERGRTSGALVAAGGWRQDRGMRSTIPFVLVLLVLCGCESRPDCVVTPNDTVECS